MYRRILKWGAAISVGVVATLVSVSVVLLQPDRLKARLTSALSRHLNLDAELEDLSVSLFPRPHVSGVRLILRVPQRPDLPPFITIDHFSVGIGLLSAIRKHVDTVHADGLKIVVPPTEARNDMDVGDTDAMSKVIVDHLVAHDAVLTFAPRDPKRPPLVFAIHSLAVDDVGFGRPLPFSVVLTNPIPTGLVDATGTLGPWRKDDSTLTAVVGQYTFTDADLATINGIGGTLSSTGTFQGHLAAIGVTGEATVPNLSLDLGGKPLPLSTKFDVVVDGTDGAVELKRVDAKMVNTTMTVSGTIANLPGPGRHDVQLAVGIPNGRIENLLDLAITSPRPVMLGAVTLQTKLSLPPGSTRVRERIRLAGQFGLSNARFTDKETQHKIQELSRRSQGKAEDDPLGPTLTNLRGRFVLRSGMVSLDDLTFEVPGATVALDGTYDLSSTQIDLHGSLRMQTSVSKAVGGFKSIFIKPFDRLFRREGAGAVVPIRISGPRETAQFAVEWGKVFRRGK